MAPEFDPREVLEKYVSLLNSPSASALRDASELAHPKDVIKYVLQHCIRVSVDGEAQRFLRNAYLALASFQRLSCEERRAAALLSEVGVPAPEGSELFNEQARRITSVTVPLQSVLDRSRAELAVFSQELELLPSTTEAS